MPKSWVNSPLHLLRGALIGTAETIPGVSGGTIALITGVYETLISSADQVFRATRLGAAALVGRGDRSRARAELGKVSWATVLPVLVGMAVALVVAARLMEPLLEHNPGASRAVFAGMILASVIVPLQMIGARISATDGLLIAVATAASALLTGFPPGNVPDPRLIIVACAAAFAVCALVLPGVSGSFLLLTLGLYAPTIGAVNDRNLAYLAAFAAGALVGLALFVKALRWLLEQHRQGTLAVMTGLMLGSLRALWPWQDPNRELHAPSGDVLPIAGLFAAGMALVLIMVFLESRRQRREHDTQEPSRAEQAGDHRARTAE